MTQKDPFEHASPRPWTYHRREEGYIHFPADWIQDANGDTVTENIGHIDGPLICAAVNARDGLAKATEAVEGPRRSAAAEAIISEADTREDRIYADITAKYSGERG